MIIGIHGAKQTGKDTAANHLISNFAFERLAWADKVKEALAVIFDLDLQIFHGTDEEKNQTTWIRWSDLDDEMGALQSLGKFMHKDFITYRELMQLFGTDVMRAWMPKIWVMTAMRNLNPKQDYVVSDVRFFNEASAIKRHENGWLIKIKRPGNEPSEHASERELPDGMFDRMIVNDGTVEDYKKTLEEVLQGLI
jgi:hypothetical protein